MMGFTTAIATCFRKYATFSGRATRAEYWWFALFNIVFIFGLVIVGESLAPGLIPVLQVVLVVFLLATLLPYVSVHVRRLHDIGLSGWYLLPYIALSMVPVLGFVAMAVWMAWPSQKGDNRFGPDPRPEAVAETFS